MCRRELRNYVYLKTVKFKELPIDYVGDRSVDLVELYECGPIQVRYEGGHPIICCGDVDESLYRLWSRL